ncbi:uncharacterized protein BDZ83DRAFT_615698 [Colletotrichum acutatum]|uniref:Uncharacterized protein n=1 Tax=Glomerella acutata TaxID=27357 RepID=A0AAD8XJI4_GLOAC|nr:uncharacterized protein BDZ83DRAFT_615698 [Colletotrichum acutatum]KAK1726645.1 hypothetical protein BDZ83DRAFT_615698 [Colletotrichum acutatum]
MVRNLISLIPQKLTIPSCNMSQGIVCLGTAMLRGSAPMFEPPGNYPCAPVPSAVYLGKRASYSKERVRSSLYFCMRHG